MNTCHALLKLFLVLASVYMYACFAATNATCEQASLSFLRTYHSICFSICLAFFHMRSRSHCLSIPEHWDKPSGSELFAGHCKPRAPRMPGLPLDRASGERHRSPTARLSNNSRLAKIRRGIRIHVDGLAETVFPTSPLRRKHAGWRNPRPGVGDIKGLESAPKSVTFCLQQLGPLS
ncbi:hypothetical protein HDK77DRAFT_306741 [Phyllosticta capitalensis]